MVYLKLLKHLKKRKIRKVLDLACGTGRHLVYLSKLGFEVYGIDISNVGVSIAKQQLQNNNLLGEIIVGSIYRRLPYRDNCFDGIICIRALHHHKLKFIKRAINEMKRVLRPSGMIYLTVRKEVAKEKRVPFIEIAPYTYIPLEGKEKGIIHYIFTEESLKREFSDFKIEKLWVEHGPREWEAYYSLLGILEK